MNKLTTLCLFGAVVGATSIVSAGDGLFGLFARSDDGVVIPAPQPQAQPLPLPYESAPAPAPYGQPVPHGYGVPSYPAPHAHAPHYTSFHSPRVCIEDPDHIHPCAVPRTIMVPNPCRDTCCHGCESVPVTICVPPCACEDYKCKKNGCYQKFDYGKYEVEVRVKKGYVEVDYDD